MNIKQKLYNTCQYFENQITFNNKHYVTNVTRTNVRKR